MCGQIGQIDKKLKTKSKGAFSNWYESLISYLS